MKPANVMLKSDGTIKVLDFGIAREYKEGKLEDTTLLGTRGFAAPEQFKENKRQTDARTDIYSLGSTMYVLLTDENPESSIPIREISPDFLEGLEHIILKARSFRMEDRYQSADEMLWDLEHVIEIGKPYRRALKKKLGLFVSSLSVCILAAGVGTGSLLLMSHEKSSSYEQKINISTAADYNTKISSYEEAINIIGSDPRAYIKLLERIKMKESLVITKVISL